MEKGAGSEFSLLMSNSPPGRARKGRGGALPSIYVPAWKVGTQLRPRSVPPPVRGSGEGEFWWWRDPARAESGESGCRGAWRLGRSCFSGFWFCSGGFGEGIPFPTSWGRGWRVSGRVVLRESGREEPFVVTWEWRGQAAGCYLAVQSHDLLPMPPNRRGSRQQRGRQQPGTHTHADGRP